jgi:hypothetical protein
MYCWTSILAIVFLVFLFFSLLLPALSAEGGWVVVEGDLVGGTRIHTRSGIAIARVVSNQNVNSLQR